MRLKRKAAIFMLGDQCLRRIERLCELIGCRHLEEDTGPDYYALLLRT